MQPLLNGVNTGLQAGSVQICHGINDVGSALQHTENGVGTMASNAAVGLGGTVRRVPAGVYGLTQRHGGLAGLVLDRLVGRVHSHRCHFIN